MGKVSAVKLEVECYNSFNEIVKIDNKNNFTCLLQDLNATVGSKFSNDKPIKLPDHNIRKLHISVKQVCFANGKIVNNDNPNIVKFTPLYIENKAELYMARNQMSLAICYPEQHEYWWLCACGRPNDNGFGQCVRCGYDKLKIFNSINRETFLEQIQFKQQKAKEAEELRILEEQSQLEQQNIRNEIRKSKIKRAIILSCIIILMVIIGASVMLISA